MTTVHLSNGITLHTRKAPEEWQALIARASTRPHDFDATWVTLEDGRQVLVQLRHVAVVEPEPEWKPRPEPPLDRRAQATDRAFGPVYSPE